MAFDSYKMSRKIKIEQRCLDYLRQCIDEYQALAFSIEMCEQYDKLNDLTRKVNDFLDWHEGKVDPTELENYYHNLRVSIARKKNAWRLKNDV